jgi:hypothetical protein
LCAGENDVPGKVEAGGYDCAHADGEEGEAGFACVEVVYAGEDYGVGLEEDVEYGICGLFSDVIIGRNSLPLTCVTKIQTGE